MAGADIFLVRTLRCFALDLKLVDSWVVKGLGVVFCKR